LLTVAFSPLIEGGTTHLPVFIIHTLILSMLVVHIYRGVKGGALAVCGSPLDRAVAAFVAMTIISVFIAHYKYMALTWMQLIVFYALFFYLARAAVSDARALGYSVFTVLGMGAVQALLGIIQRLSGTPRPTGSFFNTDMMAGYLAPSVLLAISLILLKHVKARGLGARAALLLFTCAGLLALFLTGSRGGALALLAGLLVILWVRWRVWALAAVALLTVLLLVLPTPIRDRMSSNDVYAYSRTGIWTATAAMTADHPQGVGLGNFKYYWSRYNFPVQDAVARYGRSANTAHSEYLQIGAEMGVAGLLAFLYGAFLLTRLMWRSIKMPETGGDTAVAAGVSGGITAILVHAAVDSNLHEPGIVFLLILLAVMLMAAGGQAGKYARSIEIRPDSARKLTFLVAVLILLLFLWTALTASGFYYSEKCKEALKGVSLRAAKQAADSALTLEPGNAAYHSMMASILYRQYRKGGDEGYFTEAMQELGEAEGLNPEDPEYPSLKAQIESGVAASIADPERRREMLSSALKDSLRASALNPYGADILYGQAGILVSQGRREDAAALLEKLKALEPNYLKGRLALAGIYMDTGRYGLSRGECYSILKVQEGLKNAPLAPFDKSFIEVNMDELGSLLKKTEGR